MEPYLPQPLNTGTYSGKLYYNESRTDHLDVARFIVRERDIGFELASVGKTHGSWKTTEGATALLEADSTYLAPATIAERQGVKSSKWRIVFRITDQTTESITVHGEICEGGEESSFSGELSRWVADSHSIPKPAGVTSKDRQDTAALKAQQVAHQGLPSPIYQGTLVYPELDNWRIRVDCMQRIDYVERAGPMWLCVLQSVEKRQRSAQTESAVLQRVIAIARPTDTPHEWQTTWTEAIDLHEGGQRFPSPNLERDVVRLKLKISEDVAGLINVQGTWEHRCRHDPDSHAYEEVTEDAFTGQVQQRPL
jgi:hypothetical protein